MHTLHNKVRTVVGKELMLLQTAKQARADQERLSLELAEIDRLLGRKDEMLKALESLQLKAQAKNKGVYEELLTSLINEIMPGKEDKIVLTSSMKNNRASLDIDVLVDGELENVDEDKGGSISNIVAMGLRFIVLARHPNRRVLLLDEADCHLRVEYIPAFAAVMSQLASRMGIQVLYISHHPANNFMGYGRVHELYRDNGRTHSRVIGEDPTPPEGYEAPESAIRYMRLKNFGPHENLFIELSPGLNVITGQNDLGKSKLIQAIAELTTNSGKERRITHKKPFFEVEVGLEEGMSLLWRYQRKGSKKTLMELHDENGGLIESSDLGSDIPDWLHTYLAMAPVNGENIHFHSQKNPSYLLSNDYSSIERAQMIPMGRESRDVLRMIQLFNARLLSARTSRQRLAKELNKAQNLLATMSLILENQIDPQSMYSSCDELLKAHHDLEEKGSCLKNLERLTAMSALYGTALKSLERHVIAPVNLIATEQMEQTINRYQALAGQHTALAQITSIKKARSEPVLHDLDGMAAAGIKIKSLADAALQLNAIHQIKPASSVDIQDRSSMERSINAIGDLQVKQADIYRAKELAKNELKQVLAKKNELIAEMGGICPTCDKPMGGHDHV